MTGYMKQSVLPRRSVAALPSLPIDLPLGPLSRALEAGCIQLVLTELTRFQHTAVAVFA